MSGNYHQGTPEWLEARRGKLTSSRMQTVVYGTYRAWNTLMGVLQAELEADGPPPDQWAGRMAPRSIRWGHHYEEAALENAALDRNWDIVRPPFVQHPTIDYIGASSDALIVRNFEIVANAEVKCPTNKDRHTIVRMNRQIPGEHHVQMTCQLSVHDLPISYFISYQPDMPDHWSRLCILDFHRNLKLEEEMLSKAADFMEIFRRGDRAEPRQVSQATGFPDMSF